METFAHRLHIILYDRVDAAYTTQVLGPRTKYVLQLQGWDFNALKNLEKCENDQKNQKNAL